MAIAAEYHKAKVREGPCGIPCRIVELTCPQNVVAFLVDGPRWETRPPLMIAAPQQLQNGGLKLPPFPPRDYVQGNPNPPPPKVELSEKEAHEMKVSVYAQLDDFDG